MKKFILFVIFLALVVGAYGFFRYQGNVYSKDVVKLEILGPTEVDLLQEVTYTVKYKNNGDIRLEKPELVFELPENTLTEDGVLRIVKKTEELGEAIYPGEEKTLTFTARLLGTEGEMKTVNASLSYYPKNLTARYESKTSFSVAIKKVALNFDFDLPSEIESGKEFKFRLNYFSNVDYPLSNLGIILEYPNGFEFINSTPKSIEKDQWEIGLLNKAEGGRVEITGKLVGQIGEEKVFRAKVGIFQGDDFIELKEITRGVSMVKPALHITQQINGNPKLIANPGDLLHYEIFFKNVGEDFLTDMFLLVNLSGSAFDLVTIQAPEGDFTMGEDSIIWDWRRVRNLQILPPKSEGRVEFWVRLRDDWDMEGGDNTEIKTVVFLNQAKEEFVNKVNSRLTLVQRGYFNDEVFGNTGPLPPEVGKTTTYTVTWQVKNYFNDLKNVKVKTILPTYVSLTGKVFPESEASKITFDSNSRELIWNIGDLTAMAENLGVSQDIYFQVAFLPRENQRGQVVKLLENTTVSGQDSWTGEVISAGSTYLDTSLPDDEYIPFEKSKVK